MLESHEEMGQKMKVVTSFNQRYYDHIGKDCVVSFLNCWPQDIKLTVYVEEFALDPHPRIEQIDFSKLDSDYLAFQSEELLGQGTKKFAKKAYSFIHAMHNTQSGWIVWLDADVISIQEQDADFWTNLLDDRYLSMYLGVVYYFDKNDQNEGRWLVPETGICAVNTSHPDFDRFRDEYTRRYHQRDFEGLRRTYDNDVFGAAVEATSDAEHFDLCKDLKKPYKTPLPHTILGSHLIHFKAKHSKAEYGKTQEADDQ